MFERERIAYGSMLFLCGLLLLIPGCGTAKHLTGNGTCNFQAGGNCSLNFGGLSRQYVLHVPNNYPASSGALVLVLHGSQMDGQQMESLTGLDATSDQAGFAVAYPTALDNNTGHTVWNVFYNDFTFASPPDDVGFLRALIQTLEANLNADPKKIYVAGFSNGGFMAHRVGVQASDVVAAIAVAEGTLSVIETTDTRVVPPSTAPISVLNLHGTATNIIPFCGVVTSSFVTASQDQTFNYWAGGQADACTTFNTTASMCVNGQVNSAVPLKDASGCLNNTEVVTYQLIGGAHLWNRQPMNVPGQVPFNPNFNATTGVTENDIIWKFFASHPKP